MPPDTRIHRLTIFIDSVGQTVGAGVTWAWDTSDERSWPYEPGPFDTPQEVLERLLSEVDVQLRLW